MKTNTSKKKKVKRYSRKHMALHYAWTSILSALFRHERCGNHEGYKHVEGEHGTSILIDEHGDELEYTDCCLNAGYPNTFDDETHKMTTRILREMTRHLKRARS